MTQLFDQQTSDAEQIVVAWLTPIGRTAIKRRTTDPLPFRIVREVANFEDDLPVANYATVSVHTLASTESDCVAESKLTHQRMLWLVRNPQTEITVAGGIVTTEWVEVDHAPIWVDYENEQIFRKVGRYQLAVPFNESGGS